MSEQAPRLVMLTGSGPAHTYVTNIMARTHELTAVVVDSGRPLTKVARMRQLRRRYTTAELASRLVGRLAARRLGDHLRRPREIREVLGSASDSLDVSAPVIPVAGLNTDISREIIARLHPDVLLVYGTGIVGGKVLAIPTLLSINLHTGIAPNYRGAQCAFWPLYNGEPAMVGATVHECVAELDAGQIYRVGHALLQAADREFAAFARCVQLGADLYVDTVTDLKAGVLKGRPQDLSIGRVYTAAMKGWREERLVRRNVANGLIRRHVEAQGR